MATKFKNGINVDGGNLTVAALTASQFVKTDSSKNLTSSANISASDFASAAAGSGFLAYATTGGASGAPTFRSIVSTDLPTSGVTANAYAYPSSVTVDTYGRITSITAGSAGTGDVTKAGGTTASPQTFTGVNEFTPGTDGSKTPVTVSAKNASQTADIFRVGDGANTPTYYFKVDKDGKIVTTTTINNVTVSTTTIPTTSGGNTLSFTTSGATSLTVPTSGTLAILGANTFTGTQTMPSLSISAQAANLSMNSNKITNVTNPTSAQDAATKTYADKKDSVKLTATSLSSVSSGSLTAINVNNSAFSTVSGNSGLNVQTGTATPTGGASIANGFIQVNQACWINISGQITWPSANTTGLRFCHIRHYGPTGGTNYLVNFYDGVMSPQTAIAETPLLGSSSYSSNVSMTVYAAANDFFNLWAYHTQGTSLTPLVASLTATIISFT